MSASLLASLPFQPDHLDDLVWAIMHEVTRMVYRVNEDDVVRACNQVRTGWHCQAGRRGSAGGISGIIVRLSVCEPQVCQWDTESPHVISTNTF